MDASDAYPLVYAKFAVRRLREAALSPIPDLDEVAPPDTWLSWPKNDTKPWLEWDARARALSRKAVHWRDELTRLIGDVDRRNLRRPHPDWPGTRLASELGYVLTRDKTDAQGKVVLGADGLPEWEYDPDWGPPETVLGEFTGYDPSLPKSWCEYVPGSHPALHLGNAMLYLGPPPLHLTNPPFFERVNGETAFGGVECKLQPADWWEYSGVLLKQCLIERTRALELCAWVEERSAVWESAYYPTIYLGPEPKKGQRAQRSRTLRVLMAGKSIKLARDTIPSGDADRLLELSTGKLIEFPHRKYANNLISLIPPLSGLLRNLRSTTLGGNYSMPAEVKVLLERQESGIQ